MRRLPVLLVLTGVVLAGCSTAQASKPAAPRVLHVSGSISVGYSDPTGLPTSGPCQSGGDGYTDVATGAEVVITDDAGATLVITQLGMGAFDATRHCVFPFSASVPAGKRFYGVQVSHRGTVKESEADMGHVALTLG